MRIEHENINQMCPKFAEVWFGFIHDVNFATLTMALVHGGWRSNSIRKKMDYVIEKKNDRGSFVNIFFSKN